MNDKFDSNKEWLREVFSLPIEMRGDALREYERAESRFYAEKEKIMMMMNGRKFICNIYDDEDREICINSFCEFIADLTQRGVTFRTTGKTRDGLLIFDVRY